MRCAKMAAWIILGGLTFVIPWASGAWDDQSGQPRRQGIPLQSERSAAAADMPEYIPPVRSAPGGRVGGSTRGPGTPPTLSALAPDHTGLTIQEQPALYWYLSKPTTYPIEFTIIDDRAIQPLAERRLSGSLQPGVQRVRLADYGMRLSVGVPYRWSVALVVDPDNRSRDIIAGGAIERIAPPTELHAKLARAGKTRAPYIYAEAGLWYDALTVISDLIDATPNDRMLRQERASLLEQIGLPQIADLDMRPSRTP
jgi:Domain of Unknown Function (DUF928)